MESLAHGHVMRFLVHLVLLLFVFSKVGAHQKDGVEFTDYDICEPNPSNGYSLEMPSSNCQRLVKEGMASKHPEMYKTTPQILQMYGYPYKTYKIHAEDNYIITTFRITGSPRRSKLQNSKKKPAVILLHGLIASSDGWFFLSGNKNLPFKLADAGYEVWLPNTRGTTYSMEHRTLSPNLDLRYWDFSWHEMGVHDVPALTDKAIKESGNKKVFYGCHSMGCTMLFVALSEKPELNKKIHAISMLAPQAFMGHMNGGARRLMVLVDKHEKMVNTITRGRFPTAAEWREVYNISPGDICDHPTTKCGLCDNFVYLVFGTNPSQMNNSMLPVYYSKIPNSFPLKAMAHYAQITTTCTFRKYDYGEAKNLIMYGQAEPPAYNLRNIITPLYFFYALMDVFVPANDVNITAHKLRPGVLKGHYQIKDEKFRHGDFIIGKDADKLIYNKILDVFDGYRW